MPAFFVCLRGFLAPRIVPLLAGWLAFTNITEAATRDRQRDARRSRGEVRDPRWYIRARSARVFGSELPVLSVSFAVANGKTEVVPMSRLRVFHLTALLSGLLLLTAAASSAFGQTFYACAQNTTGMLRLVQTANDCRPNESAVTWRSVVRTEPTSRIVDSSNPPKEIPSVLPYGSEFFRFSPIGPFGLRSTFEWGDSGFWHEADDCRGARFIGLSNPLTLVNTFDTYYLNVKPTGNPDLFYIYNARQAQYRRMLSQESWPEHPNQQFWDISAQAPECRTYPDDQSGVPGLLRWFVVAVPVRISDYGLVLPFRKIAIE